MLVLKVASMLLLLIYGAFNNFCHVPEPQECKTCYYDNLSFMILNKKLHYHYFLLEVPNTKYTIALFQKWWGLLKYMLAKESPLLSTNI